MNSSFPYTNYWYIVTHKQLADNTPDLSTTTDTADMPIASTLSATTKDVHTKIEGTEVIGKEETEATMAVMTPSNLGVSVTLIGAVVGGVGGSLSLVVLAVVLLLLILVWMTRKNKRSTNKAKEKQQQQQRAQLEGSWYITTQHVQLQQQQGDRLIKVKSNCAYNAYASQIPMVDNVAYGQIRSDYNLLSNQSEYEYV